MAAGIRSTMYKIRKINVFCAVMLLSALVFVPMVYSECHDPRQYTIIRNSIEFCPGSFTLNSPILIVNPSEMEIKIKCNRTVLVAGSDIAFVVNKSRLVEITGCTFSGFRKALIVLNSSFIDINNNSFESIGLYAIKLKSSNTSEIKNNTFNSPGSSWDIYIDERSGLNSIIDNNINSGIAGPYYYHKHDTNDYCSASNRYPIEIVEKMPVCSSGMESGTESTYSTNSSDELNLSDAAADDNMNNTGNASLPYFLHSANETNQTDINISNITTYDNETITELDNNYSAAGDAITKDTKNNTKKINKSLKPENRTKTEPEGENKITKPKKEDLSLPEDNENTLGINQKTERLHHKIKPLSEKRIKEIIRKITTGKAQHTAKDEKTINTLTKKAIKSRKIVNYSTKINFKENKTTVSLIVKPKKDVKKLVVYEQIPKKIANSTKEINFSIKPTKIIIDDPLIMWEFADVRKGQEIDLSYKVNKRISPEELKNEQPGTVVIAEQGFFDKYNVYFFLLLIPLIVYFIIYFSKETDINNNRQ